MKKLLTYSVVIATIVWSLGLAALVPAASAAYTPVAGDVVKTATNTAVYYIDSTGKRHLFSNEATFWTWKKGNWAAQGVKVITQAEFDALSSASNVIARPGVNLIKFDNSSRVYAVTPGGVLRLIPTSAVASALYGANWSSKVVTIQSAFENDYQKTGADLTATSSLPDGSLIKYSGSDTIYYIEGGKKRATTAESFLANNFKDAAVITVPASMTYEAGSSITGQEAALVTIAGAAVAPVTGGALSVNVAATNPASANIISDANTVQALTPFLAVNLTASSQGDVKVTGLKFERTGISADTDLNNFYIYEGNNRLAEGGSLSSKVLSFNDASGIITVPAGTTKTIVLKADLTLATSGSKTIGFNLTAVTSNAASVSASYPIVGNLMSTALVTDLGYASLTALATPTANTDVKAGEVGYEVSRVTLTANDQDLQLVGLRLTAIGTIGKNDLANIKLVQGGTTVATASFNNNMELYFDLATPFEIAKGNSKTFSVQADVVGGSTKTFKLAIEKVSDVVVKDKSYGVLTVTSGTFPSRPTYQYTVQTGALSIVKDNTSASGSVSANATNVKIATFKVTATGEDVKVKNLLVQATTTNEALNGGLQNGKVYYDGVQVGSTKNLTEDTSIQFDLGSSMIVPAGATKLVDIYADVKTTTGTAINAGSIFVTLKTGSQNAQGMTSLTLVNAPTSDVAGNSLTVAASSLATTKYTAYGNQTLTAPASGAKVGSFVISAGANEGVNVSSIYIANATSGDLANMKLMSGTTQIGSTKDVLPSTNSTTTFAVSNLNLEKGTSKVIDIIADIKSGTGTPSFALTVNADGTTPVTNTAVTSAVATLQTITLGSGSLSSAAAGDKPDSTIILAGASTKVNSIKYTALNEAYTITNLRVANTNSVAGVASATISYPKKDGSTGTATQYFDASGNADFNNLAIYVPKNGTAVVTVNADMATIDSGATSGSLVVLTFAAPTGTTFVAQGELSGTTIYTGPSVNTGNSMVLRKSKPTVTLETLPTTILTAGTQTIAKFKITADAAGDVIWKQIAFTVTTTTNVNVTASTIKLYKAGDSTALNTGASLANIVNGVATATITASSEQTISKGSSQIYELKADITGAVVAGDSISTKIKSSTVTTAGTTTTVTDLVLYEGGFAWSDSSATPHTATSRDWADSQYVKDLPTASQTIAK